MDRKSPEAWVNALGLRRRGREWCGPCPLCGGRDRFHVGDRGDGTALVGCRGCLDGGQDPDGRRFGELLRAVFPDSRPAGPKTRPQDDRGATQATGPRGWDREQPTRTPAATLDGCTLPSRVWAAAESADLTPAHAYLTRRGVWPPDGDGFPALPAAVRWLPRGRVPQDPAADWYDVPRAAAGAVVFRFGEALDGELRAVSLEALDGELRAVSLEALDGGGRRRATRWRRTYGERKGSAFVLRPGIAARWATVVLTEGEVSALAATWLHPGAVVLATGGTAGLRGVTAWLAQGPQALPVVIEADGDPAGRQAAFDAAQAIRLAGRKVDKVDVVLRRVGDPADEVRADIEDLAGRCAADGMTENDATAAAWRLMLERTVTDGTT